MNTRPKRLFLTLMSGVLALALTACGNSDDKKTATQVAAKVGSEEISVHQINQILSRSNTTGVTPEAVKTMSREVLERLIDQQLAVDQAIEDKLHRSPEVVSQIEASRREILARAYLQKIVSALPKPTPDDVRKYYAEHPDLFAQRRIFNVQEIVVPATAGVNAQLRTFSASARSLEDAAAWLNGKGIKFGGGNVSRAAEQIPMDLLAKIHPLKDGQSMVVETAQTTTLLRIASSQSSPVSEEVAQSRIEQFLGNQNANEAVANRIKALRASTQISYMGDFDKAAAAPAVPASAPVSATTAPMTEEEKTKATIEKGVSGLK